MQLFRLFCIFSISYIKLVSGSSTGAQLAKSVKNLFANTCNTIDVCILRGNPVITWKDFLDNFLTKLPERFAVTLLGRLAKAPKRCDFHAILLEPVYSVKHFNELLRSFLEAVRWNRYGKFAFVGLEEITPVLENQWMFYQYLMKTLGITNSVLIVEKKGAAAPVVIQFNYFEDELIMLDDVRHAQ